MVIHIISLDTNLIWITDECCFRGDVGIFVGTWGYEPSWKEIKKAIMDRIIDPSSDKTPKGTWMLRRYNPDGSEHSPPFQISNTTIAMIFKAE